MQLVLIEGTYLKRTNLLFFGVAHRGVTKLRGSGMGSLHDEIGEHHAVHALFTDGFRDLLA